MPFAETVVTPVRNHTLLCVAVDNSTGRGLGNSCLNLRTRFQDGTVRTKNSLGVLDIRFPRWHLGSPRSRDQDPYLFPVLFAYPRRLFRSGIKAVHRQFSSWIAFLDVGLKMLKNRQIAFEHARSEPRSSTYPPLEQWHNQLVLLYQ